MDTFRILVISAVPPCCLLHSTCAVWGGVIVEMDKWAVQTVGLLVGT
jgi:hypothetical protein